MATAMSTRTLKTGFTEDFDVFGGIYYSSTPAPTRLAAPLTTTWTQPTGCSADFIEATGSCKPPAFDGAWDFGGYYSPGLCFSGFTVGCTADQTSVNWEPVTASETVGFCVPKDYGCLVNSTRGYERIRYATSAAQGAVSFDYAVQIRWQSTDKDPMQTAAATASSGRTALGSTTNTGAATNASGVGGGDTNTVPQPAAASNSKGLSSGAIAGIVVGVVVLLALIGVGVFFLLRRRRREREAKATPPVLDTKPELDGQGTTGHSRSGGGGGDDGEKAELGTTPRQPPELGGQHMAAEMTGSQGAATYEMGHHESTRNHQYQTPPPPPPPQTASTQPFSPSEVDGNSTWAAASQAPSSAISSAGGSPGPQDMAARHAQLEERRRRLLEIQQIEEEQESIRQAQAQHANHRYEMA